MINGRVLLLATNRAKMKNDHRNVFAQLFFRVTCCGVSQRVIKNAAKRNTRLCYVCVAAVPQNVFLFLFLYINCHLLFCWLRDGKVNSIDDEI